MEGTVIADLTAKLEALERQEQGLLCQEEENHLKRRISKKRKAIEDLGQASFKNLPRKSTKGGFKLSWKQNSPGRSLG